MPKIPNKPYWQTTDGDTVRLYQGDTRDVLRRLPEKSVHCVVTSPPYWGLRDYGVDRQLGSEPSPDCGTNGKAQCGRCFVCAMVEVFREVYRVLRDDGTLWLNLGDTYGGGKAGGGVFESGRTDGRPGDGGAGRWKEGHKYKIETQTNLKSGNLVGVPWRVALALQANGWILRQDIIWAKKSPMPESVRNRCTKAHEYVFLFAKRSGYFYDAEAVRESAEYGRRIQPEDTWARTGSATDNPVKVKGSTYGSDPSAGRNKRSVWTVSFQGYEGAHFATYPPKLIEPMIKAGTSEKGCCSECGAPWKRTVEEKVIKTSPVSQGVRADWDRKSKENWEGSCGNDGLREGYQEKNMKTVGWEPTCECNGKFEKQKKTAPRSQALAMPGFSGNARLQGYADMGKLTKEITQTVEVYVSELPLEDHPVIPCTVLDPFIGSGTTCCVSLGLGRRSIGIDLSEQYLRDNAVTRIKGVLLGVPRLAVLAGHQTAKVEVGRQLNKN